MLPLYAANANSSFFQWVWSLVTTYWPMFLKGAGVTLLIAITATITGSVIGLLIGVVRTIPITPKSSRFKRVVMKIVNFILTAYIEVFRGTPMIVQAMVIFYGAAMGGVYLPTLLAGYLIVSVNTGAYMAEIVRGGILSIDKGQFEAAHSIGMSHTKTMRSIILPPGHPQYPARHGQRVCHQHQGHVGAQRHFRVRAVFPEQDDRREQLPVFRGVLRHLRALFCYDLYHNPDPAPDRAPARRQGHLYHPRLADRA